ncbi:MAG: flagellar hook-basal body complex protein FliE [Hydrogenoanaerobacterium sp.]
MFIVPISPLKPLSPLSEVSAPKQQSGLSSGVPFADVLKGALKNMEATQAVAQRDSMNVALGNMDDLHTMQINATKAETAASVAVGLTGKVLSVYNEILRMQI